MADSEWNQWPHGWKPVKEMTDAELLSKIRQVWAGAIRMALRAEAKRRNLI